MNIKKIDWAKPGLVFARNERKTSEEPQAQPHSYLLNRETREINCSRQHSAI